MAILTNARRENMGHAFADSGRAVVATDAVSDDAGMIENGRRPCGRCMTVVALVAGRDVSRCLARRLNTVMTAITAACQRRMVHKRDDLPVSRDMTIGAFADSRDVVCRFE